MALDQAYFDAIKIDIVKKKYYNANKVEAVLADIRRQALLMGRENELLGRQLFALHGQKDEIGDTLLSAKTIAQQIIADAQTQAEKILTEARRLSRNMTSEAEKTRDEALAEAEAAQRALPRRLEEMEQQLRLRLLGITDEICGELRGFSALAETEEDAATDAEGDTPSAEASAASADEDACLANEDTPVLADLSEKVDAIARELGSIGEEESD